MCPFTITVHPPTQDSTSCQFWSLYQTLRWVSTEISVPCFSRVKLFLVIQFSNLGSREVTIFNSCLCLLLCFSFVSHSIPLFSCRLLYHRNFGLLLQEFLPFVNIKNDDWGICLRPDKTSTLPRLYIRSPSLVWLPGNFPYFLIR